MKQQCWAYGSINSIILVFIYKPKIIMFMFAHLGRNKQLLKQFDTKVGYFCLFVLYLWGWVFYMCLSKGVFVFVCVCVCGFWRTVVCGCVKYL